MFLHLSVILFTGGGRTWWGVIHGRVACMAGVADMVGSCMMRGVHGKGVCLAGGHAFRKDGH